MIVESSSIIDFPSAAEIIVGLESDAQALTPAKRNKKITSIIVFFIVIPPFD
jgi:hypothetical protein